MQLIGRLKRGVTQEQAQAEVNAIASRLEAQYPEVNTGLNIALLSSQERLVGKVRPALLVMLGAVGFVLLIACANVANLMLARATARRKEIAIRTALGASRWRSCAAADRELAASALGRRGGAVAGAVGHGLAGRGHPCGHPAHRRDRPRRARARFTAVVSMLTGIIFGLVPALQASQDRSERDAEGRDGARLSDGTQRNRVRGVLVVTEIALALVLLVGAGLMIKSFCDCWTSIPGFDTENVLTARVTASDKKYAEAEQRAAFYHEAIERVETLPGRGGGRRSKSATARGKLRGYHLRHRGPPALPARARASADRRVITSGLLQAMSIPDARRARRSMHRDREKAPRVVIINETFARRYFAGEDTVGRALIPRMKAGNPSRARSSASSAT